MKKLLSAAPLIVLLAMAGACASASANSKPDRPDLVVPPPPPRVVEPTPEPQPELPAVSEVPAAPPAAPATRSGRGTRETAPKPQPGETKPDTKIDEPPAPPAPAAPVAPAPQLRTAESTGAEGTVRATIDHTRQMLEKVDYRRLSTVRKKAYDDAKRFAQQAEDALKAGNTTFAQGVAAKGETLARELAGG